MTPFPSKSAIKLRADDAEGLKIVAACLQDAIVPLPEVCLLPDRQAFVMVVNRFKWETLGPVARPKDGGACYQRTNCAVSILGVTAARRRRIDPLDPAQLLELLTILPSQEGLDLIFSGDSAIHLTASRWCCLLEDLGESWPVSTIPHHPVEEAAGV